MNAVLSVTNQKGGVAKTTTALHLAVGLARQNPKKKTLYIDLDPQRNGTDVLLKESDFDAERTVFHLFQGNPVTSLQLHETEQKNLMVIPSSLQLVEVETMLSNALDGFFRLNENLAPLANEFDFTIIDCPPSLSVLTINALVAARGILIPLQASKFSVDGIQGLVNAINTVQKRYNANLEIIGGVFTMFNERTTISQMMTEEISQNMKLFNTNIPSSVAVEEAHLLKQSLYDYAPKNKVAIAYEQLTKEVYNVLQKIG
ncbi:MAG: ParA family protein [Leptospirales bacterium]